MKELADIQRDLRAALPALKERYPIRSLALFGSYVRNEARPDSDLDVLLEYEEPISLFELARLQRELETITGLTVDLVPKTGLKPRIGQRILEEAQPL